jgi:PAT family acetyl-CoA transporter-like MFS transporter 1
MWPNSFTLWFVDFLTWKECIPDLDKEAADSSKSPLATSALVSTNATLIAANSCNGAVETDSCSAMGGVCHTLTDGYFSLSIACVVVGLLWFVWGARALRNLQEIDVKEWRVVKKPDEKASEKSG